MGGIIEVLKMNPTLSIILGFVLAVFLAYLFRDTISLYIKKKYNLFDEDEIRKAITNIPITKKDNFIKLESLSDEVIKQLKDNK